MTKHPVYETPEERRRRLVEEFLARYPHPMIAWAERQSPFWQIVLNPNLTSEGKAILVTGAFGGKVPKVPERVHYMGNAFCLESRFHWR
jgi:hypothetical protein